MEQRQQCLRVLGVQLPGRAAYTAATCHTSTGEIIQIGHPASALAAELFKPINTTQLLTQSVHEILDDREVPDES